MGGGRRRAGGGGQAVCVCPPPPPPQGDRARRRGAEVNRRRPPGGARAVMAAPRAPLCEAGGGLPRARAGEAVGRSGREAGPGRAPLRPPPPSAEGLRRE